MSVRTRRAAVAMCLAACLVLSAGCSCSVQDPGEGLEDIEWALVTSSASAVDFRATGVTARFADGVLRGFAGVNTYTATYELGGDGSLSLGELKIAQGAGTPEAMRAEETYLTLLRAVRSFTLEGDTLELADADGLTLLVFEKATVREAVEEQPPTDVDAEQPAETTATTEVSRLSVGSVAHAASIGGTSHRGELLYFIIGSEHTSEAAARAALDAAVPLFGDMQTYFIVQHSDNLAGLSPGRWVIVEAYRSAPDESDLQLARRAFPDARVQRATVSTGDPIPVYDDLVP